MRNLLFATALCLVLDFTTGFWYAPEKKVFKEAPSYRVPCTAAWCDPSHEPEPNSMAAMTGYNILKSNPFAKGNAADPGLHNALIFMPTVMDDEGRVAFHEGLTVAKIGLCHLDIETKTVKTLKEYKNLLQESSKEGTTWASNLEFDVCASMKGVSVSTTIPPLLSGSSSSSKDLKEASDFMSKTSGVMQFNEATCSVYRVQIDPFKPPPFSQPMINALAALNDAVNATAGKQRSVVHKFIDTFGTHFFTKVIMGARLVHHRKYSAEEYQRSTAEDRSECNEDSFNSNLFGIGIGTKSSACTKIESNSNEKDVEGFIRESYTAYGSQPKETLIAWAGQEFTSPLPIKMELSPLLNIFQKSFMVDHPDIKFKEIVRYMAPIYYSYCEHKEGSGKCDINALKGCGFDDDCVRESQYCIAANNEAGYECCDSHCAKNPCQNGGICLQEKRSCNNYQCYCPTLYSGQDCSISQLQNALNIAYGIINSDSFDAGSDNRNSAKEILKQLRFKFSLDYYFSVTVYGDLERSDLKGHGFYGTQYKFEKIKTKRGRKNMIVSWSRIFSTKKPTRYQLDEMKREVVKANQIGCDTATKVAERAYKKLKEYGFPVAVVYSIWFGNEARGNAYGGARYWQNFECGGHDFSLAFQLV